jgi:hypothetical protein
MDEKPDVTVAEGPFAVTAQRVLRDGKPYVGGTWLRATAASSAVVCEVCGPLAADSLHGWTSDWLTPCSAARAHAQEAGHEVVVESWQGAIYGPERQ